MQMVHYPAFGKKILSEENFYFLKKVIVCQCVRRNDMMEKLVRSTTKIDSTVETQRTVSNLNALRLNNYLLCFTNKLVAYR